MKIKKQIREQEMEARALRAEASLVIAESSLAVALARITALELLLQKHSVTKTSKNSHQPPSLDLSRKNQSLREKSEKPVGGQLGHEGNTLKLSAKPDETKEFYPKFCNRCGLSLATAEFKLTARRQVIDIPPIVPITTEFRCFGTFCHCGHHQTATFPQGVDNYIQYGPNIQTLAIYNSCFHLIPFARLQDFFSKVCHLNISKGTIENIIRRTAKKALPTYETLRQAIAISFFVGSDETGFKVNGSKFWFWVWQNIRITYIVASGSRSKKVISDVFPEGLPNTILCSDRLAAQLSTITKGNQVCIAHLLRDLNYLIEAEQFTWSTDFKNLLKQAIELKNSMQSYSKNNEQVLQIEKLADKLLDPVILEQLLLDKTRYKQTITFFRAMSKLRHALFPFLYDDRIPFHNNGSERAFRMAKVKTKISGQFKSLHQEFAIIRSVVDTAIKNDRPVFEAINAMVNISMPLNVAG